MKKRILFWLLILLAPGICMAQYRLLTDDSLQHLLQYQYTTPSAMRNTVGLARLAWMLPQEKNFDSLKNILIAETELSRDRNEMCRVNLGIARIYLRNLQAYELAAAAKPYIEKASAIADEGGLDLYKAGVQLRWASFYIASSQLQKALNANNQALAIALSTGNDSLITVAYSSLANTHDYLDNTLSRFQAMLSARSYAERTKQNPLILRSLLDLGDFYRDAEQMEKSRDTYSEVIKLAESGKDWDFEIDGWRGIGRTYRIQHQKELAVSSYNSALSLANQHALKREKVSVTIDLLNYYFNEETPDKGLAYLAANPELAYFIKKSGLDYQLNKLYAIKYELRGNYDSALYYMKVAAPVEMAQPQNFSEKIEFFSIWARVLTKSGQKQAALDRLLVAEKFADSSSDLQRKRNICQDIDSAYLAVGDYKKAFEYYGRYNYFRDTIEKLGTQKDLINADIEDAGKRAEADKQQELEQIRRRDNLEYLGITAAIATLFIILMVLGVFRMSVSVIKGLGFFAFIFLFEFITLLLDKQIHEITHGEPWKILAIKIILIAMLLPLHHFLEHKAVVFLTSKAHLIRKNWFGYHKEVEAVKREQ